MKSGTLESGRTMYRLCHDVSRLVVCIQRLSVHHTRLIIHRKIDRWVFIPYWHTSTLRQLRTEDRDIISPERPKVRSLRFADWNDQSTWLMHRFSHTHFDVLTLQQVVILLTLWSLTSEHGFSRGNLETFVYFKI